MKDSRIKDLPKDAVYELEGNRAPFLDRKGGPAEDSFWKSFRRKFRPLTIHSRLGIVEARKSYELSGDSFAVYEDFFRKQADDSSAKLHNGKSERFYSKAADFYIAEMERLRDEIVDIKNRELTSERLVAGGALAMAALYLSGKLGGVGVFVQVLAFFTPIFFMVFGYIRAKEYQRNIFEIDCYLREVEYWFSPVGGWVNYFFRYRAMEKYFHTRLWVWVGIGIFYLIAWLSGLVIPPLMSG